MNPRRYNRLLKLIAFNKPKRIIEIGTHKGKRADLLCRESLKYNNVHYVGYDLFETATEETDKREMNGKGAGSQEAACEKLEKIKADFSDFTYELIKGDTRETLHGTDQRADFVFIDGGHSEATIRGDYEAVKHSRLVAFDDYYVGDIPAGFGCNAVVAGIPHELMPEEDTGNGLGVKIAVVGYSSKWEAAINRVMINEKISKATIWRGDAVEPAELICALNSLESQVDLEAKLDELRQLVRKRLFFVIKADALRSLPWWRATMDKYFQLVEWFSPDNLEVVGTAMPLAVVGEWKSIGAMNDDARFENTLHNVKVTDKRLKPLLGPEGEFLEHDRRAIIVAYGPSLRETWSSIIAEKKYTEDCDVISMSGSHDFLLRRNIIPDYHVECDPRPHKAQNLMNPREGVKYYIASCCHPDLTDKLKDFDLSLWHLMNGEASYKIVEEIESEKNEALICGGGSVGLRAIALFYGLGYRKFSIYGMDCSFGQAKDGTPVSKKDEELMRWAGAHKGKKKDVIKVRCGDKWFLTSPVDVTYTRHFVDTAQRSQGASFSFVGEGLLQEMVKQMQQESAA
jgi:hypothetical protein